jgi:hypothetical protein
VIPRLEAQRCRYIDEVASSPKADPLLDHRLLEQLAHAVLAIMGTSTWSLRQLTHLLHFYPHSVFLPFLPLWTAARYEGHSATV